MKTILVPTDFSETAKNAAQFAISFAKQVQAKRIILYNAFQSPVVTDPNMALVDVVDIKELQKSSEENLQRFKMILKPFCSPDIAIDTISEYGMLAVDINDVCQAQHADAIVMGVTGTGKLSETLIGSFAIDVARHAKIPVIIVPPGAGFTEINEIMLACDFSKVVESTPVGPIKRILDETGARLFVVHVDHNKKHYTEETPFESLMLDTLLQGYKPEYHFVDNENFVDGINNFALEKQVDLIITIPKKIGWFEGLFHKSHTKALAFHSHVPIMIVHE